MDTTREFPLSGVKESKNGNYTAPIARTGEQQFACIMRNRSGMDSGEIDFGARFIDHLCPGDQQAAVDAAFAVYEKWCRESGMRARRDTATPRS